MSASQTDTQSSTSEPSSNSQGGDSPAQVPDSRSPNVYITTNPNSSPQWPAKYAVNDKVWVWRESTGQFYQATVTAPGHWTGSTWSYYLSDANGVALWAERVMQIPEGDLKPLK